MKYFNFLFICLFVSQISNAQSKFAEPEYIKTIILKPSGANLYAPYVRLGQTITLSFDDLNADEYDYSYRIEHCTIDWKPSDLIDSEFISGYAEDRIRNFTNSFNTLLPYTHYSVSIPNEDTRIKISGNYIISVLDEDNQVVFKRKFIVYENKVTVGVAIFKSRDLKHYNTKQAVEFSINHPDFRINNPREEIIPIVLQNDNWQTAITNLKPQFYRGNQLLYKYNKETSFWAGNEFLYFDSKSIRNSSLNIARVEQGKNLYHSYLFTNEERNGQPYTLREDINGNFVIRSIDGQDSTIDADYSWVHFSLECLEDLSGKDIYVHGNFNNWQLKDSNKLIYNNKLGLYQANILLKQGFYNYQFITKNKEGVLSNYDIDGSHYLTENNYTVLVYYKKFGSRYTEVIGIGYGNSRNINN
ncbi:protein of unknown function [Lutibacter oricola]|uniref:Type 9 secretion system plug protein N-terminal domain-containing protein n=1 Tax=Lutibacter oricola TaxID=762486 RepID=A0A1H2SY73_9FLAO|nr:DUF5103 domain-containing protein [Lutibacter oricola]SDW36633.1 protein of unknown function [Lutibacter oricola]